MKFVKLDPPGTICFQAAFKDMLRRLGPRTFLEVGCGGGDLAKIMCAMGMTGVGVDFSVQAMAEARKNLAAEIAAGRFTLLEGDVREIDFRDARYDVACAMLVIEHVEDDVGFLRLMANLVEPGGHVIVGVPGRMDAWGIEDDTAGHLRRYERDDLIARMGEAGLQAPEVWSIGVPVANLLLGLSNAVVRRSHEIRKLGQSAREQTEASGIRDIPFKTVFPAPFKLLLNPVTLYPLILLQRLYYPTNRGLTMLGYARVPDR